MKIEPIYTLKIDDDSYINCGEEVRLKCSEEFNELTGETDNGIYEGIFEVADNEGIWVEIGKDASNKIYILYDEIDNIEIK